MYYKQPTEPTTVSRHFKSSRALVDWFNSELAAGTDKLDNVRGSYGYGWTQEESSRRAQVGANMLMNGNTATAHEAAKLMHELRMNLPTPKREMTRHVQGQVVHMGAFLSGVPNHMIRREPWPKHDTPLRVYVGITAPAGTAENIIKRRGIAIAAFAMSMASIRPVYIIPYTHWVHNHVHATVVSWELKTSPMVLSQLCALAEPDVTRWFGIYAKDLIDRNAPGSSIMLQPRDYARILPRAKGDDLILGYCDTSDPLVSGDPVKWVKAQIEKYGTNNA